LHNLRWMRAIFVWPTSQRLEQNEATSLNKATQVNGMIEAHIVR
jgi:hypothetical protein